jgi:hypothetical protein|tara:strand:+ start:1944 stop:2180 length:237 start_codon:yes stop_codon:yes gene_type:complete
MYRFYDFKCVSGHINEHMVKGSPDFMKCKECDAIATRQLSSPRSYLEPFSGDFAGASLKWAKNHEQGRVQAEKANPEY